jgi:hypothetical protein
MTFLQISRLRQFDVRNIIEGIEPAREIFARDEVPCENLRVSGLELLNNIRGGEKYHTKTVSRLGRL